MSVNEIAQYGIRVNSLITNCSSIFGMSSGVAGIHPDTQITAKVNKSAKIKVDYHSLPAKLRKYWQGENGSKEGIAKLQEWIEKELDKLIEEGRTFKKGEAILKMDIPGIFVRTFFKWNKSNQPVKVVGYKNARAISKEIPGMGFQTESVEYNIVLELTVTSQWWKLRNDGIKCTTVPTNVKFFDENGEEKQLDWDILFPMEALKGRLATLVGYTYANGGGVIDMDKGQLNLDSGLDVDLLEEENEIYNWIREETQTLWLEYELAMTEWEILKKARGENEDIVVMKEEDTYVVLREKCHILPSEMVVEVEVSTPRENGGKSGITLEMGASMSLQNRKVGERLNKESDKFREAVNNLVCMAVDTNEIVSQFDVTNAEERLKFAKALGNVQQFDDSSVVEKCKEVFPKGVRLIGSSSHTNANESVYLNFEAIRGMSTFIGGSAEGIGETIVAFVKYLQIPLEGGVDNKAFSRLRQVKASLEGWVVSNLESKSILKRITRIEGSSSLKVRTVAWKELHHNKGELPKIGMNPNDEVVRNLAKNAEGEIDEKYLKGKKFHIDRLNGEIIEAGRTPMPMGVACELVLMEKVDIGHAVLLPHIWAMTTEGDTDGDGIINKNLSRLGITLEEALEYNKSFMSMPGYVLVYGEDPSNWPCAEFVSYKDKWGKKALFWENEDIAIENGYLCSYIRSKTQEDFKEICRVVNEHYLGAVGIAYNICVVLTHQTTDLIYKGVENNEVKLKKMAMVFAWRILYEGLGLGGFSHKARRFYQVLRIAAFNVNFIEEVNEYGELVATFPKKESPKSALIPCLPELVKLGGFTEGQIKQENIALAVVKAIVKACRISFDWTAIERNKPRVAYMSAGEIRTATLYGALRRAGQGKDVGGIEIRENYEGGMLDEGEDTPPVAISIMDLAEQLEVYKDLNCPWINRILQRGIEVHNLANTIIGNKIIQENSPE
jgi:hypothetical protein